MQTLLFTLLILLQTQLTVPVTLQVRYLDGGAFNLPIQIRSDEGEPLQTCEPDESGRCTVELQRGLYLIEPTGTQLDAVSAVAAVEIGGRWLAITVGDEAISYGFVIDEDAVYFDSTPDEAFPRPIRPNAEDIAAHFATTDDGSTNPFQTIENSPTKISAENTPNTNVSTDSPQSAENPTTPTPMSETVTSAPNTAFAWRWLILLLVTLSLLFGWLWWYTRRQQTR